MPSVQRPEVLKAVYHEATGRIRANEIPTELIENNRTLYRASDTHRFIVRLDGTIHKRSANDLLMVRDQATNRNRFSGQSLSPGVRSWGGVYFSLQQSALVNELLHYAGPEIPRGRTTGFPQADRTLECKCILKIRLMTSVLAADLSPHNPTARRFVEDIGRSATVQSAFHSTGKLAVSIWQDLFDGEDCSVARGIGLAVADSGLRALQASTVRPSERSRGEAGDNLVFFGRDGQSIEGLWIEQAYLFPVGREPQVYPVEF